MKLTDFPTFVINLDRNLDRWQNIEHQLRTRGFTNYFRLPAIDGEKLTDAALQRLLDCDAYDIVTNRQERTHHEEFASKGSVGCYLSHLKCWELCVRLNQPILIIEDDAILLDGLNSVNLPDLLRTFDIVMLASFFERNEGMVEQMGNNTFKYNGHFFCLVFYCIQPDTCRKLLKDAYPLRKQVDSFASEKVVNNTIRLGYVDPPLAYQGTQFETTAQKYCPKCGSMMMNQKFTWKIYRMFAIILGVILIIVVVLKNTTI